MGSFKNGVCFFGELDVLHDWVLFLESRSVCGETDIMLRRTIRASRSVGVRQVVFAESDHAPSCAEVAYSLCMPLRASIVQYLKIAWLLTAQFDKVDEEFLRGGLKTHPMGPSEPSDERKIVS
jgi:hypothetical protein